MSNQEIDVDRKAPEGKFRVIAAELPTHECSTPKKVLLEDSESISDARKRAKKEKRSWHVNGYTVLIYDDQGNQMNLEKFDYHRARRQFEMMFPGTSDSLFRYPRQ